MLTVTPSSCMGASLHANWKYPFKLRSDIKDHKPAGIVITIIILHQSLSEIRALISCLPILHDTSSFSSTYIKLYCSLPSCTGAAVEMKQYCSIGEVRAVKHSKPSGNATLIGGGGFGAHKVPCLPVQDQPLSAAQERAIDAQLR